MSPGNGSPTTSEEIRLLEDISDLRHRVRARHREHALWAALVGLVALGGAAVFLLAPEIREMSCHPPQPPQTPPLPAVVCGEMARLFAFWWYWPLAASASVIFAFVRRHRRGTWRMTSAGWLIAVLVVIFVLPTAVSLLPDIMPPVVYPLAAAAVLAGLATSRRSVLGVAAALTAAARSCSSSSSSSARLGTTSDRACSPTISGWRSRRCWSGSWRWSREVPGR